MFPVFRGLQSKGWLILAVCMLGCTPPSADPKPSKDEPNGKLDSAQIDSAQSESVPESPAVSTAQSSTEAAAAESTEVSLPSQLVKAMEEGRLTWQRWLWLNAGGPVSMDLIARVESKSFSAHQEAIADEVLRRLFPDKATITWEMIWQEPVIRDGFFAHIKAESPAIQSQLTKKYDANKDEVASPLEVLALLTRGLSAKGIALDEDNQYRNENRDRTPLFVALDVDANGRLSQEESSEAASRLLRLDLNGDFLLSRDELASAQASVGNATSGLRVEALPVVVIADRDPQRSTEIVNDHYGGSKGIPKSAWSNCAPLFDAIDSNQNGTLNRTELHSIWRQKAQLVLEVDWSTQNKEMTPPSSLSNEALAVRIRSDQQPGTHWNLGTEGEARIENDRMRVRIASMDLLGKRICDQRLERYAELMGISRERSTAIVEGLGGPSFRFSPKGLDRDRDGRLNWAELEWGVDLKAIISSTYMRVRLADVQDGWFAWLDLNWDGVLSEDEIHRSPDRLRALTELHPDSDSDLAPESLPVQLHMVLVRSFADENPFSDGFVDQQLFQRKPAVSAPAWFSAMDVNGDGLVTPREFIGSEDDLRSFDRNRNGWLDPLDFEAWNTNPI